MSDTVTLYWWWCDKLIESPGWVDRGGRYYRPDDARSFAPKYVNKAEERRFSRLGSVWSLGKGSLRNAVADRFDREQEAAEDRVERVRASRDAALAQFEE